ncbi:MAG: UMP kinase [Coxiella-like endosymbiont]|uniref:UMP kinase n=1 Tax=Coxiella-like endosymbiont TaxID=1592897 RepID=UPI00215A643F|nr:UMP kinase [Coxiella-like endosymbiont]UVE59482.1 UMP kinase [Coxiella-like endosymbiont]
MTNGPPPQPLYQRILLKMSGEALMWKGPHSIDPYVLDRIAKEVTQVYQLGVQIAIVIGGGNFFRGAALQKAGINRMTGDFMGMLATLMNALALRDAFERSSLPVRILSAIPMIGVADAFHRRKAIHHLKQGRVVIFAAGTGNPLVTTDSAASLRGIEIGADIVLKATNVDGVYSEDPAKNPTAKLYKHLTYQEALEKELSVMDLAAFCQCRDHNMPLRVFNIKKVGTLLRVILDKEEGTLVDCG